MVSSVSEKQAGGMRKEGPSRYFGALRFIGEDRIKFWGSMGSGRPQYTARMSEGGKHWISNEKIRVAPGQNGEKSRTDSGGL